MPIIKHNIYDKEAKEKIQSILVPELRKEGFTGSYPHFRRPNKDGGFDILSFQFNKCGGSFLIEISAAYPYREEFTNCCLNSSKNTEEEIKKINHAHTHVRRRIHSRWNECWFDYSDGNVEKTVNHALNRLRKEMSWFDNPPIYRELKRRKRQGLSY